MGKPIAAVALACESQSTRSVRWSAAARQEARFTAVVVFPTPPFWFATAIIRAKLVSPCESRRDWRKSSKVSLGAQDVSRGTFAELWKNRRKLRLRHNCMMEFLSTRCFCSTWNIPRGEKPLNFAEDRMKLFHVEQSATLCCFPRHSGLGQMFHVEHFRSFNCLGLRRTGESQFAIA